MRREFVERQIVAQYRRFLAFYGTRNVITALTDTATGSYSEPEDPSL
jgi:hypothetical protein